MFCKNCGAEINDEAAVCIKCGALTDKTNIKSHIKDDSNFPVNACGIAGFVIGLVSLFLSLWCIVPSVALVLSSIGFAKRKFYKAKGLTIAGFIISIIAFSLDLIYLILTLTVGFALL